MSLAIATALPEVVGVAVGSLAFEVFRRFHAGRGERGHGLPGRPPPTLTRAVGKARFAAAWCLIATVPVLGYGVIRGFPVPKMMGGLAHATVAIGPLLAAVFTLLVALSFWLGKVQLQPAPPGARLRAAPRFARTPAVPFALLPVSVMVLAAMSPIQLGATGVGESAGVVAGFGLAFGAVSVLYAAIERRRSVLIWHQPGLGGESGGQRGAVFTTPLHRTGD